MESKLTKEEEQYIKLLLQSKPKPQVEHTKQWIDKEVRILLAKYRKPKKLF